MMIDSIPRPLASHKRSGRKEFSSAMLLIGLTVACSHGPTDATILSAIDNRVLKEPSLGSYSLRVESRGGAVSLTGSIGSNDAKTTLESLVRGTNGVKSLTSNLTVAPSPQPVKDQPNPPTISNVSPPTPVEPLPPRPVEKKATRIEPPTITATAQPPSITAGQNSILNWSTTNADRVTIDGQPVPVSGSKPVVPSTSTVYDIVASNRGGEARTSIQVTVAAPAAPPPEISISIDRPSILRGQEATLSWKSNNAVTILINGERQATTSGSKRISPNESTTYQATASNSAGQTVQSAPVALTVQTEVSVTIPSGTPIEVRMIDSVNSKAKSGQRFQASLWRDLQAANGFVVAKKGVDVYGQVVEAKQPRLKGRPELRLELTAIYIDNQPHPIRTSDYQDIGSSRGKGTVEAVGVGAGAGAAIGAAAGGGTGAAVGAGAGAAAGTIERLIFGGVLTIPTEEILRFVLREPVIVMVQL